jgi:tetratricopeptide (TPR) repeat protein
MGAGNYRVAEERFRAALKEAEAFGETDGRVAATISNLAAACQDRGAYQESEALYRRALELRENNLGPEHRDVAASLNNLAALLRSAGRSPEADPLLRRALLISDAAHDEKLSASIVNTLGLVLRDQGEFARAEPLFRRSRAMFAHSVGEDSLDVAKTTNNLALLYADEREDSKAEIELRRALALYEKLLGPEHPILAGVLNNMFTVLGNEQKFDEAAPYLQRAIDIEGHENPDSPRGLLLRTNLATLEITRGRFDSAARMLQEVIAAQERVLGPNHPQLAVSLENYSAVLKRLHQNGDAKRAQSRANAIINSFR